jgi:hypothetical protein
MRIPTDNSKPASANPNEVKGLHFQKIDSTSAKFSDNFNDFVDFPLKGRFLEEVEGPRVGRRCSKLI